MGSEFKGNIPSTPNRSLMRRALRFKRWLIHRSGSLNANLRCFSSPNYNVFEGKTSDSPLAPFTVNFYPATMSPLPSASFSAAQKYLRIQVLQHATRTIGNESCGVVTEYTSWRIRQDNPLVLRTGRSETGPMHLASSSHSFQSRR